MAERPRPEIVKKERPCTIIRSSADSYKNLFDFIFFPFFTFNFSFNLLSRASKSPFWIRLHKIPAQTPMKNTGSLEIGWAVASQ